MKLLCDRNNDNNFHNPQNLTNISLVILPYQSSEHRIVFNIIMKLYKYSQ